MELPLVVHAEHRGGFHIYLRFTDGADGVVDFAAWLNGPVFEPLKDPEFFTRFFLEGGTVAWPNGADIAPETLHDAVLTTQANPALQPTAPPGMARRG